MRGERPALIVPEKAPQQDHSKEELEGFAVPRSETRRANHRDQDRHRLIGEKATARHDGKAHEVELINLSAGGAMIRAGFAPRLWDMVELELGEGASIEAAVRWRRHDLIGLEFAHETRIDCEPEARSAILLEVIRRSFPDLEVDADQPEPQAEPQAAEHRSDKRHPLIWNGVVHCAKRSHPVRLRNISSGGALVDVEGYCPAGVEVVLDLGDAGKIPASVGWTHGEQAGLRFHEPFDMALLAKAKPEVAPNQWVKPSYLDKAKDDSSPWHAKWKRGSVADIRSELEGFLRH